MRTHFLRQLEVAGREQALALESEFDLYRAKRVLKLEVRFSGDDDALPSLQLELAYDAGGRRYKLALLLEQVRELVIPPVTSSLFLPELEIEDIRSRMIEGARFEVVSHFERAFRCTCGNIAVVFFEPV